MRSLAWLRESFRALDRVYFAGHCAELGVTVHWMKWYPCSANFRFGSYAPHSREIHIHRTLSHLWVPVNVVDLTLFHEMLHATHGLEHDLPFKLLEQRFHGYLEARLWEAENVDKLITSPRPNRIPRET